MGIVNQMNNTFNVFRNRYIKLFKKCLRANQELLNYYYKNGIEEWTPWNGHYTSNGVVKFINIKVDPDDIVSGIRLRKWGREFHMMYEPDEGLMYIRVINTSSPLARGKWDFIYS